MWFNRGGIDSRHCIDSNSDTYYGTQWVTAELIVLNDSLVTHIINGKTVLEYTKLQIGGVVVNGFDPKIKKGCMDPKAMNFREYYVISNKDTCSY